MSATFLPTYSGCSANSNLFKSNSEIMTCVTSAAASPMNSDCQVPYGTGWGVYQPNNLAPALIYSHSIVTGDSLCQTTGTSYHYYTMLYPYIAWTKDLIGRKLRTYQKDKSYVLVEDVSFSMNNVAGGGKSGTKLLSGDFYPTQQDYTPTDNSTLTTASTNTTTAATKNTASSTGGIENTRASVAGDYGPNDSEDINKNDDNIEIIDKNAVVTVNGTTVPILELFTDPGMSDLEITRVVHFTETDSNGKLVLVSNIDVETYAYSDFTGNSNNIIGRISVSTSATDSGIKSSQNNAGANSKSNNGLSRGAIIAIGIVAPIVTILILIGLYFLHKWWRARCNAVSWDSINETASANNIRIIDVGPDYGSVIPLPAIGSALEANPAAVPAVVSTTIPAVDSAAIPPPSLDPVLALIVLYKTIVIHCHQPTKLLL